MGDAQSQQQQEQIAADAVAAAGFGPISPHGAVAPAAQGAPAASQPGQGGMDPGLCESALLSQLVQLLGQRQRHSLLLSDLGALLPGPLRHGVKEKGGLRSWLQKYPQLFQVSGQPGKESVTLLLGSTTQSADAQPAAQDGSAAGHGQARAAGAAERAGAVSELDLRKKEEDEANESAVQLRGLPYRATVADIKAFLTPSHCANLKDENSVQLVLNRDGRPSGFARVQFKSPVAARAARDEKHMQVMEVSGAAPSPQSSQDRYVEIFLFAERPNKLRFKKTATADGGLPNDDEDIEAMGITKEHVISECCQHMNSPGKGQLLLSMLGVALSQGARLYLKKTDQGLKHFLAQYPNEFSVDGPKGRECISYLPALKEGGQNNRDLPANFPDSQKKNRRNEGTGGPATGSISDIPHDHSHSRNATPAFQHHHDVPMSPKVSTPFQLFHGTPGANNSTPKGIATPSDWGTPQPFGTHYAAQHRGPTQPADDAGLEGGPFGGAVPGYNNWSAWAMPPPQYWPGPPGVPMNFWGAGAGAPPNVVWGQGPEGRPDQQGPPDVDLSGPPAWERAGGPGSFGAADPCPFGGGGGLNISAGTAPSAAAGTAPGAGAPGVLPMDAVLAALAQKMGPMGPFGQQMPAGEWGKKQDQAPAELSGPSPAVRLRGLPFSATEQDVYAFFGKHDIVERVAEDRNAVRMIMKGNGKASGQAVVILTSRADIPVVQQVLNGQYMGQRYIEVFQHTEEDDGGAGRQKDAPAAAQQVFAEQTGDTGGSGGSFPPQWDRQQQQWGQWGMQHGMPQGLPPGAGGPPPQLDGMALTVKGAGTGDGGGAGEEAGEASWQALFGFLKHSQEEPPMPPGAALHGLGAARLQ